MRFPHAHRGVKLIFIAEIVALASAVVALIAAVFVSIASSGNTAVANSAGTMLLVASIASIVWSKSKKFFLLCELTNVETK